MFFFILARELKAYDGPFDCEEKATDLAKYWSKTLGETVILGSTETEIEAREILETYGIDQKIAAAYYGHLH